MRASPFLLNPGSLIEVRFLGKGKWSVFTSDPAVIASTLGQSEVAGLDAYQTLNPLDRDTPEKHSAPRDMLFRAGRGQLSRDGDVTRRKWLLLDSDVVKPTGAAATDPQREAALKHSAEIEAALTVEGWPHPLACGSGNGAHRLYPVDLPNDRDTAFLLSNFLHIVARKFDSGAVTLDKSVSNAGRITRLYGTQNHKAGRRSAILFVPVPLVVVTSEQLKSVVEKWRGSVGYKTRLTQRAGDWTSGKMEAFLDFYSIDYRPPVEIPAGVLWVLTPCPLNADHIGSSPAVILTRTGWPKFRCMHNSCSGVRWSDFCKKLYQLTGKWFVYVS